MCNLAPLVSTAAICASNLPVDSCDALNCMVKRAYDEGINALLEFNGSATTNLTHRYLWSDQVDELLADSQLTNLTTAGNALWALSDHLGTIRDIADYTSDLQHNLFR